MIKSAVSGTPLEGPLRAAWAALHGREAYKAFRYDRETIAVMRACLKPTARAIDVGAHDGAILREMIEIAPSGTFDAFEPLPEFAEKLRLSFHGDRRVVIHQVALSDARGAMEFQHVVSNPAYSGLRRRVYARPDETIEAIRVDAVPLDEMAENFDRLDFLKIDVEGGEVNVLRGAAETIARFKPTVVFEHGRGGADQYGFGPTDVWEVLVEKCGLAIFTMRAWLQFRKPMEKGEFCGRFAQGTDYYFLAASGPRRKGQ